ncbi:hypothetical protein ACHAPQ_008851 [Fusarium lateritium]
MVCARWRTASRMRSVASNIAEPSFATVGLGVFGNVGFMNRNQRNMQHLIRNGHYVAVGHELTEPFETALFRRDDVGAWNSDETVKLRVLLDKGPVPLTFWERDTHGSIMGTYALRIKRARVLIQLDLASCRTTL